MEIITSQNRQAVVSYHGDILQIVIPAKKDGFMIFFLSVWLIIWAVAEVASPLALIGFKDEGAVIMTILILWMIIWTVVGFLTMFALLWNILGREVISVGRKHLSIKNDVLGYGRWRQYESSQIKALRVSKTKDAWGSLDYTMQCWGLFGGMLAFEYQNRTYRFGMGIEASAAREILQRILHRYTWLAVKR